MIYTFSNDAERHLALGILRSALADSKPRTYETLDRMAAEAKPGEPFTLTDGTHTFTLARTESRDLAPIAVEPVEHSEVGASIAKRIMACAGSVRMAAGMPNESTPAAERGTAMHEVAALCLSGGQDALEYVGRTVNGIEIDADMADLTQVYIDRCRSHPADARRWIEHRFNLSALHPAAPMFGTADHVAYLDGTLWVDDLKSGYLAVEADDNVQLKYYALGAMLSVHPLPVTRVVASIVQPRRGGVKPTEFDPFELMEWSGELLERVAATQEPDAALTPGPHCRDTFCPAAGSCAAYAAYALEVAGAEFDAPYTPPTPEALSSADLGRLLLRAPDFEGWLKSARAEAERRARLGDTDLGWRIVETEGREAWINESTVAAALSSAAGLTPGDLMAPPEPLSPARARAVLTAANLTNAEIDGMKLTKKAAEAAARVTLAPFVRRPVGTALVPATDSRPALAGPGSEFDALPAETLTNGS